MFVIVYFFLDGFFEFEYKSVELVFKWMMQKINFYNDIFSQVFVVYIVKEVLLDDSFDVFKKGWVIFLVMFSLCLYFWFYWEMMMG